MADSDKNLIKSIEELLKTAEDRKSDPQSKALIDALNAIQHSEPARKSFADLISSQFIALSAKAQQKKKAAESGTVSNDEANVWFDGHWAQNRRNCSICGVNNWALNPQFVHLSVGPMGASLRTRSVPCVCLVCRNCAHTMFFNAIMMELLPKDEE